MRRPRGGDGKRRSAARSEAKPSEVDRKRRFAARSEAKPSEVDKWGAASALAAPPGRQLFAGTQLPLAPSHTMSFPEIISFSPAW